MDHELRRKLDEIHREKMARREATKPRPLPKVPLTQRLSRDKLIRWFAEESLSDQRVLEYTMRDEVPAAWHVLEYDLDVSEPKVKVTLWLDKSVAQFYRAMGKGYQARVNRILALYAHMKIAKFLDLEKAMNEDWW